MARKGKLLKHALRVIAFVIFVVQMAFALDKYFSKPSMVAGKTMNIMSVESPILITICKVDQVDLDTLEKYGYTNEEDYYGGNVQNQSLLSWTGTHGNFTTNETVEFLFDSKTDRIDTSYMDLPAHTRTVLPFGQCKYLQHIPGTLLKSFNVSRRYLHM